MSMYHMIRGMIYGTTWLKEKSRCVGVHVHYLGRHWVPDTWWCTLSLVWVQLFFVFYHMAHDECQAMHRMNAFRLSKWRVSSLDFNKWSSSQWKTQDHHAKADTEDSAQ